MGATEAVTSAPRAETRRDESLPGAPCSRGQAEVETPLHAPKQAMRVRGSHPEFVRSPSEAAAPQDRAEEFPDPGTRQAVSPRRDSFRGPAGHQGPYGPRGERRSHRGRQVYARTSLGMRSEERRVG